MSHPAAGPPRLIADAMLGSLARWLRTLGIDVAYERGIEDADLVAAAVAEDRIILTRDRRLVERRLARNHLLIRSPDVEDQVRQVLAELAIEFDVARLFSRCLRCNEPLVSVPAEEARQQVPPFVAATQDRFRRCPTCGRIYWRSTHVERMRERLRRMGVAE